MFYVCDLNKKKKKTTPVPLTFPSCFYDELQGLFTSSEERCTDRCFVPKHSKNADILKNNCAEFSLLFLIVKAEMFSYEVSYSINWD